MIPNLNIKKNYKINHLRRVKRVSGAEFELQLEILSLVQRARGSLHIDYPSEIIYNVNIDLLTHAPRAINMY